MRFVLIWLLHAVLIMLIAHLLPGITLQSFWVALVSALVLGLVNALVRPILIFLTLPAVVLTFGLALVLINAVGLWLVAALVPGFQIASFWDALLGSLLISALSAFGRWLLKV
jgi:putative membrane protein